MRDRSYPKPHLEKDFQPIIDEVFVPCLLRCRDLIKALLRAELTPEKTEFYA